mmetsp:Transcript_6312/g.26211  ORF Transcript_6312/g.26211 Transcript_6312/m.26211 type:complete len:459 (-) Transcript_6312:26-1402(-)
MTAPVATSMVSAARRHASAQAAESRGDIALAPLLRAGGAPRGGAQGGRSAVTSRDALPQFGRTEPRSRLGNSSGRARRGPGQDPDAPQPAAFCLLRALVRRIPGLKCSRWRAALHGPRKQAPDCRRQRRQTLRGSCYPRNSVRSGLGREILDAAHAAGGVHARKLACRVCMTPPGRGVGRSEAGMQRTGACRLRPGQESARGRQTGHWIPRAAPAGGHGSAIKAPAAGLWRCAKPPGLAGWILARTQGTACRCKAGVGRRALQAVLLPGSVRSGSSSQGQRCSACDAARLAVGQVGQGLPRSLLPMGRARERAGEGARIAAASRVALRCGGPSSRPSPSRDRGMAARLGAVHATCSPLAGGVGCRPRRARGGRREPLASGAARKSVRSRAAAESRGRRAARARPPRRVAPRAASWPLVGSGSALGVGRPRPSASPRRQHIGGPWFRGIRPQRRTGCER